MLKLLVVDDEYFVRRGIIDSICWKDYQIDICGEAANGVEALALLRERKPDFILSDIRMSPMDGLEFIKKSRETFPDIKFIILSGYDEFDYARRAITLGVSEYLLKPVGAEELVRVITRVRDEILEANSSRQSSSDTLQTSMMSVWNTPQNRFPMEDSYYQVLMFSVENPKEVLHSLSHTAPSLSLQYISVLAQNYFTMANLNYIVKMLQENMYAIMLNYQNPNLPVPKILDAFKDYLQSQCGALITVGIGKQYYGNRQMTASYNEAFAALGYKYAFSANECIYCSQIPAYFIRDYMYHPRLHSFRKEAASFLSLKIDREELLTQYLASLCRRFAQQHLADDDQRTVLLKLLILSLQRFDIFSYPSVDRKKILTVYQRICTCDTCCFADEYIRIYRMLEQVSQHQHTNTYQDIVNITIRYIMAHYSEDLSLNRLAEKVHVTPNYLSRVFKEATGKNFKEWITHYRIDQAKELLLNTSMKLYEITEAVGFHDYKYFSGIFKKITGCSASEYRTAVLLKKELK